MAGFIIGGVVAVLPRGAADSGVLDPRYLSSAQSQLVAYKSKIKMDYSTGPCLGALPIDDNWVIDIAHNPRQPVDDEPTNQCAAYNVGKAKHFIELDETGNLIQYR